MAIKTIFKGYAMLCAIHLSHTYISPKNAKSKTNYMYLESNNNRIGNYGIYMVFIGNMLSRLDCQSSD